MLDMEVYWPVGRTWPGIFIPGDSALFGADHLETLAGYCDRANPRGFAVGRTVSLPDGAASPRLPYQ